MKKLLFISIIFFMPSAGFALAVVDRCKMFFCITNPTRTAHCDSICSTCSSGTTTSTTNGVITKTRKELVYDACPTTEGQTIDCNCETTYTYSCAEGYYGTPNNSLLGCTSCVSATGNANATSKAGATAITDCYIPNGTTDTDAGGTYTITGGDCKYSS